MRLPMLRRGRSRAACGFNISCSCHYCRDIGRAAHAQRRRLKRRERQRWRRDLATRKD